MIFSIKNLYFISTISICLCLAEPEPIELGSVIKNGSNAVITSKTVLEIKPPKTRLVSNYLTVDVLASSYTRATCRGVFPFSAKGCMTTYIIKPDKTGQISKTTIKEKLSKWKLSNLVFTVFIIDGVVTSFDTATLEWFSINKVIVASFQGENFDRSVLRKLIKSGVIVVENLVKDKRVVGAEAKTFWSYLMVFNVGTDLVETDENPMLANVALFEKTEEFDYCSSGKIEDQQLVVLSQGFSGEIPIYPGYSRPKIEDKNQGEIWFYDHYGTHIDSPTHLEADRLSAASLPSSYSFLPCVKVQQIDEDGDNYLVGKSAFLNWEREANQKIPENSLVLIETGYYKFWNSAKKYQKFDEKTEKVKFPGIHPEAAKWIIKNRGVKALAIDTLSTDRGNSTHLETHVILAKSNVLGIENIGNLGYFPNSKGTTKAADNENPVGQCLLLFLRTQDGTGAPMAIFGHLQYKHSKSGTEHIHSSLLAIILSMTLAVF